jgi:RING-box protein 1
MVEDAMDADKGEQTPLGAAGTASTTTPTTTTTKRKIEVKKWNAVAVWSWSTSFDSCAICRNTLHEPSIEFQANSQQEGADGLSIAVRFTSMRAYVALVLLSFALSRILSAFSNAFVFA